MKQIPVRIAASPWAVGRVTRWEDFAARVDHQALEASEAQADLLLFPEYAGLDAGADGVPAGDLAAEFRGAQEFMADFRALHRAAARLHKLWIIAGSLPVALPGDRYVNRAWIYSPEGEEYAQDKILLTRFERATGLLEPGKALSVFQASWGQFAVNICYDSEFPSLARAQCDAGATLLLVPSDTDTPQGHHRVRIGCQARALENQIPVVQCPLLGERPGSAMIDVNVGAAACYVPPDVGFPETGVFAESRWNDPSLAIFEVPMRRVNALRRHGHVDNFADGRRCPTVPVVSYPASPS